VPLAAGFIENGAWHVIQAPDVVHVAHGYAHNEHEPLFKE
jgi:hypothetical protein